MSNTKYTKELLEPIIQKSQSVRQVLIILNLKPTGGNYNHINKLIKKFNIDRSHFLGQGHNKGKQPPNKNPISHYLNDTNFIKTSDLRIRLIKEGYFKHECQLCNSSTWLNNQIPLELHHIDCNPQNNNLSNLQILCPNCHKYIHDQLNDEKNPRIKKYRCKNKKQYFCKCGSIKSRKANQCKVCAAIDFNKNRKTRPPKEQLELELKFYKNNKSAIARKYNVSQTAVRKWCKIYNL